MITEDYVSFEIAKLLKENGFNERCTHYYKNEKYLVDLGYANIHHYTNSDLIKEFSAPTLQMAMKWLREIHNLCIEIYVLKNFNKKTCEYTYTIMDLNFPGSDDGIECCIDYETYEQACEAAIKYCLKHLI